MEKVKNVLFVDDGVTIEVKFGLTGIGVLVNGQKQKKETTLTKSVSEFRVPTGDGERSYQIDQRGTFSTKSFTIRREGQIVLQMTK